MSAVAHIDEYKTGRFFSKEFRGELSWNGWEHNLLLRNEGRDARGQIRFTDVAMATGADDIRDGRGVATADFDNDGDVDIVINNSPGDTGRRELQRATLLRNDVGNRRSWLAVELEGDGGSNRDAVGALVEVRIGGSRQTRQLSAGGGYASQQSARLYFGLGAAARVDALTVRWPSGRRETHEGLAARRLVRLREGGSPELLPLPGADLLTATGLEALP